MTKQGAALLRAADAPESVQGAIEGVADPRDMRVEFAGEWFRIADKVGLMPLMRFAHAAAEELDTADMEALAAIYDMLRDCIHPGSPCDCGQPGDHVPGCHYDPGDWRKFERHAVKVKADAEDMLPVVQQVISKVSARPTGGPSGSSDGARKATGS